MAIIWSLKSQYQNQSGRSNIKSYQVSDDRNEIVVEFSTGVYTYTAASVGREHLDEMIRLAESGSGLGAFINKNVRNQYASRSTR